jgi:hypothetical protein
LSLPHELWLGSDLRSPPARLAGWSAYLVVAGAVLRSARRAGVAPGKLHRERFAW